MLSFLIKPFFYKTKKSVQKCKYLKNKKSISKKVNKEFFIFFERFLTVRKCLSPEIGHQKYSVTSIVALFVCIIGFNNLVS